MTMVEIRRLLSLLACLGWLSLGAAQTMAPVPSTSSSASSSSASGSESEEAPVIMMDAGSFHAVVIIRDSAVNVVKNWGANGQGQLGYNDTKDRGDNNGDVGNLLPEVELGTGLEAVAVTAGLRHNAAIMNDGTVRSWGYNLKGQLGVGTDLNVGNGTDGELRPVENMGDYMRVTQLGAVSPKSITAGGWHTCSIVDDDRLKCWGYNQWGELGLEDKEDRGDDPNEMGDELGFVDLGDDAKVVSLACGDWHTCALLDGGEVKCFGKNYAGQLGQGDTENRGDEEGEMGDGLDAVDLGGRKASAIAAGEEHTCALLEGGDVVCWGLNWSGQLGQGNRMNIGDAGGEMTNLAAIDLGTGRTAVEVAAGGNHTCAILDNDSVKCWGENDFGELGQGDSFPRGIAEGQMGDFLEPVSLPAGWKIHSLSLGYYHTCGLVSTVGSVDTVVCWGSNEFGQMGLGITETENIGDDPDEMGDSLSAANLGGDYLLESDEEKWYEKQWFYIACGAAGAVLLCCLCVLCVKSHGDNSGRGTSPPHPGKARPEATTGTNKSPVPNGQETPNGSADSPAAVVGSSTAASSRAAPKAGGGMVGPRRAPLPDVGADQA